MSTTQVLEFMHKTAADITLQHELEALLGVGDGNISSEAELDTAETEALLGDRAPTVTEFAAKKGYQFSVDELVIVVSAFQRHHSGELSDEAFAQLVGSASAQSVNSSALRRLTQFLSKTYLGIDLKS
ncbi:MULTISPECIES: hypothetical protein [unclassified Leptolyngbya]|uniref:hypothetical protein n=1 Tax=unclassified Leptolyngbya TaxID=2650499 RepID=UPI0016854311|nr:MULTISPECIES: hypothetical protein [unclassified Leptolyngbya]MBD1912427.1 hypothetical protein [Leptolyngbya sp. FACHB-8]MBD2157928.1 hypothetical protein [Leptolyngbya sp. FACHB-16]